MQIDEMCIFMQEGVDRTSSQAYTVSHGKQMTADQSREKGVQTMTAYRSGMMMMCMCMLLRQPVPAFLCAKYSA